MRGPSNNNIFVLSPTNKEHPNLYTLGFITFFKLYYN